MEESKREATTVGTLVEAWHGKGSTYRYLFKVNGVTIRDYSSECKTALTPAGCVEGAAVLVYYDREHVTESMLEDFKAAANELIFLGAWMLGIGLLVLGLRSFLNRKSARPDESGASDEGKPADQSEVLHIAPNE